MASSGSRSFDTLTSQLTWAYTTNQSTDVLVTFAAEDATRGYAVLSSTGTGSATFSFADPSQMLSISVTVTLDSSNSNEWQLNYQGTIDSQGPPSTFSGVLATFEPSLGSSQERVHMKTATKSR